MNWIELIDPPPLLYNFLNIQAKYKLQTTKRTKAIRIIISILLLFGLKSNFDIVPTVYLAGR